jgi:hypothetical protein
MTAQRITDEARAALEAIRREFPEWNITFLDGSRPHWWAWRIFDSPTALVHIECLSARALRTRLWSNNLIITPRDDLGLFPKDYLRLETGTITGSDAP